MRIAIDTGGTFTDCVYLKDGQLHVLKTFSTPADPSQAVLNAVRQIMAPKESHDRAVEIRHGTTVGTNALLERKGARVAFITTAGFEDTIAIGRQARPSLYDWSFVPVPPLVSRELRFGISERIASDGEVITPLTDEAVAGLVDKLRASNAESIALSTLFSFLHPEHEARIAAALQPLGLPVSVSHRIMPEFREYERASTVCVNAYLAPKMGSYLCNLQRTLTTEFPGSDVNVMQSSGGIIGATTAADEPVRTVLSGPAGGVIGAHQVALHAGYSKIIAFDMGGTSTDVSLIDATQGGPRVTAESVVSGLPIGVPMLDIHTAGAGGGSIARWDAGGLLRVGPESAGADPGPICYGKGTEPTVTDANVLLGRLDPDGFLAGGFRLDNTRVQKEMEMRRGTLPTAEAFAEGIVRVVESTMEKAIRLVSVERGHDPRDFTLVAFGGAGPLHACALARLLRIPRVLVPALPGALSALGILFADQVRDYSRTVMLQTADGDCEQSITDELLRLQAGAATSPDVSLQPTADLRYQGQGYELNIPWRQSLVQMLDDFHQAHQRHYGFSDSMRKVEVVTVRLRVITPAAPWKPPSHNSITRDSSVAVIARRPVCFNGEWVETRVYERGLLRSGDSFPGPAIINEYSSTTVVPPGDSVSVDQLGNLIIEVPA
jgi:N-methylhydantoinase A